MERLRSAAGIAQIGGAAGSAALMVYAAQRVHAPRVLLVGFTLWVLSPFALLAFALVAMLSGCVEREPQKEPPERRDDAGYTEEEEDEVRKRLEDLGYVE